MGRPDQLLQEADAFIAELKASLPGGEFTRKSEEAIRLVKAQTAVCSALTRWAKIEKRLLSPGTRVTFQRIEGPETNRVWVTRSGHVSRHQWPPEHMAIWGLHLDVDEEAWQATPDSSRADQRQLVDAPGDRRISVNWSMLREIG
ncbi:MAG: hypothetical protein KF774_17725 [Planctomyces sp.]|nr:hypothetical protein [Planctomyces sp.]